MDLKRRQKSKIKIRSKWRGKLVSPIKKYRSMTIYKKLSISFLVIAVLSSLLIGAVGIVNLNNNNKMSQNIYNEDLVPLSSLYRIQTYFITMGTKVNSDDVFKNQSSETKLFTQICAELSKYSSTVKNPKEKAVLTQISSDITDYNAKAQEAINDFAINDSKAAYELIDGKMTTISAHLDQLITSIYTQKTTEAKQRNEQSQRNFTFSMSAMALVTLISIILATLLGRENAKLICKPINNLVKSATAISEGNLTVEIDKGDGDEISILAGAFEKMATAWSGYINEILSVLSQMSEGNLDVEIVSEYKGDFVKIKDSINHIISTFNDVIGEIIIASADITTSSKQLSEGSQSLSAGAAEQAASVEQLTASIAEIAQQTKENAISASKADKIANSVKKDTASGNDKMEQMLGSMSEIRKSAAGISQIIKVINDIAFQTNILALNASIEAARAGSYGKGFAVVAEEVRHLALRSTDAAKDTTQMIDKSIDKSAEGTKIAQGTSGALKMIEEGVNGTAVLIDEIAKSSNEQAMGISQINKGIDEVSKIVQTNSATAEQSAAASEELFSRAESMKQLVSHFNLKEN
jgi:methyl-accepting chemotaxis protein